MRQAILPLVEGHSEVQSVPILLRRLLTTMDRPDVHVVRPFRVARYKVVRDGELERSLNIGIRDRSDVAGVLVLLDADDDDPIELESALLQRCRSVLQQPARVVVACRELEAWFLGAKESLRDVRGIHSDAVAPEDPEAIRGAKETLSRNFKDSYLEVDDQPALMSRLDLDLASQRCPSFRRLRQAIQELVSELEPAAEDE